MCLSAGNPTGPRYLVSALRRGDWLLSLGVYGRTGSSEAVAEVGRGVRTWYRVYDVTILGRNASSGLKN